MLAKLRPRSAYDVMAALALFVAVSTGGAYAANTVFSTDIVDGEVKAPDIASSAVQTSEINNGAVINSKLGASAVNSVKVQDGSVATADLAGNAVNGAKVLDNSLTGTDVLDNALKGADIAESSLGQVPVATLGGLGRSAASADWCDPPKSTPESTIWVRCVQVQLNLSSPARVLLNGRITAHDQPVDNVDTTGSCRWGGVQESGPVEVSVEAAREEDMSLVGLTNVVPAGQGWTFAIECREPAFHVSGVSYTDAWITAVAISPN